MCIETLTRYHTIRHQGATGLRLSNVWKVSCIHFMYTNYLGVHRKHSQGITVKRQEPAGIRLSNGWESILYSFHSISV